MPTMKGLRIARLWSQRELASRAGVSENTIINIETGRRLPRLLTMRRIADALGVDWDEVAEFRAAVRAIEEESKAPAQSDLGSAARPASSAPRRTGGMIP